MNIIHLAEKGWLPDTMIRFGIRRLCVDRLNHERQQWKQSQGRLIQNRIQQLKNSPIAVETDAANEQHYELPPEFFTTVLGSHLKYSSCLWTDTTNTLTEAEAAMLELYAERAQLLDGQRVLELGCGWGSLSLWMAQQFPNSNIVAVSNSHNQRRYIEQQAVQRNLFNLQVITCDVNELHMDEQFDRIVSIEMFEHMRNYQTLMENISHWLKPDGALFVHIFCHRDLLYPFEVEGEKNWMGRYFFTGGQMPAANTLLEFNDNLRCEQHWQVSGTHYERTALAWLSNLDQNRDLLMPVLEKTYGIQEASIWLQRWRMFFMACAELFGYDQGEEWFVSHYRFVHS